MAVVISSLNVNLLSSSPGSCGMPEQEEAVYLYFQHLTEDNPLKFGVSGEVMEDFIESAREYNKKNL